MKRGLPILAGLLALVIVSAGVLSCQVIKARSTRFAAPPQAPAERVSTSIGMTEYLASPRAILVLDVSGSMKKSDPRHLQTEAVLRFYQLYRDLAVEGLRPGDRAALAVVLFSSIAQVVDWSGSGDPWLPVGAGSDELFSRVVERYLGRGDSDPRTGLDTDYLAAVREVANLTADLASPPVVVFMTDGLYEPHPLLSPGSPLERRREVAPAVFDRVRPLLAGIGAGTERFLSAQDLPPIFDPRRHGIPALEPTASLMTALSEALVAERQELFRRSFRPSGSRPESCLLWSVVHLQGEDHQAAETVRRLLVGNAPCRDWPEESSFVSCARPDEMVGAFLEPLARWLRLDEMPITAGASAIQVPEDTKFFAVHVQTAADAPPPVLEAGTSQVPLAGRDGAWSAVIPGHGTWRFERGAFAIAGGRIFLRSRYEWAIRFPPWFTVGEKPEDLEIEILLVARETGRPVRATSVYRDLAERVVARVESEAASGQSPGTLVFTPPVGPAAEAGDAPAFRGKLPLGSGAQRRIRVQVDRAALRPQLGTIGSASLTAEVDLRPQVRILLRDGAGHETGIDLRRVPREGEWLRRLGGRTSTGEQAQ